jgi:NADH-quinone oxidoreductase subunit G
MATIIINGTEYTLPEGERLNAIQAAQRFGIEIPYYCWHPALSVVANCRMCEIQVGAKDPKTGEIKMIPKMVPGCQTPAKDGTVIVTDSPEVQAHQSMIMEYLLINHPLDCPVCDQAGQCGLQDYSYKHGQSVHRFVEERTVNPRKDVSDQIQLNMDRCILCTRCVRFTREITGTNELQVERRGNHAEITTFPDRPLDNPLAGNVVDLCPVGALLDKDFLHKQRFWFNDQHKSICTRCSTGCNIKAEENRGQIWRLRARYNPKVNDYWICDDGRYSYKSANDANLLPAMYVRDAGSLQEAPVDRALDVARTRLKAIAAQGGRIAAVVSPFLTVEEAYLLCSYIKGLSASAQLVLGPYVVEGDDVVFSPDQRAGRTGDTSFVVPRPFTIHAEKCPNRNGVERILKHFQGSVIPFDRFRSEAATQPFDAVLITGGGHDPVYEGPEMTSLRDAAKFLVVQDVWPTDLAGLADVVLSTATFAEKAGCYVNADGRLQYATAALPPRDGSLPDLDVLAILMERPGGGPVSSGDVLAELARQVPGFEAVARLEGEFPAFGLPLDEEETPTPGMAIYVDPWHAPRGKVTLAR